MNTGRLLTMHAEPRVGEVAEPWMDDAACAEVDPELFFPDPSVNGTAAKRICKGCPVIAECLAYAMENDIRDGIWGGRAPLERRKKARRGAA